MTFSEAIEIGCKGKNQITGSYRTSEGVCALGAAMIGLGSPDDSELFNQRTIIMAENYSPLTLDLLRTWNDEDGLSFQQIIGRLRSMGL